jgi:hypothetical protein
MKFSEIQKIMDEAYEKDHTKSSGGWAEIIAAPSGIIETYEQYEYIKYWAKHTGVNLDGMKSFEEDKGRYLTIGSHFGGASFYFTTTEIEYEKSLGNENLIWSYGKYGRVEFDGNENKHNYEEIHIRTLM